jgi:hypothetical protein
MDPHSATLRLNAAAVAVFMRAVKKGRFDC